MLDPNRVVSICIIINIKHTSSHPHSKAPVHYRGSEMKDVYLPKQNGFMFTKCADSGKLLPVGLLPPSTGINNLNEFFHLLIFAFEAS